MWDYYSGDGFCSLSVAFIKFAAWIAKWQERTALLMFEICCSFPARSAKNPFRRSTMEHVLFGLRHTVSRKEKTKKNKKPKQNKNPQQIMMSWDYRGSCITNISPDWHLADQFFLSIQRNLYIFSKYPDCKLLWAAFTNPKTMTKKLRWDRANAKVWIVAVWWSKITKTKQKYKQLINF